MNGARPAERRLDRCDGQALKKASFGAGAWLEKQADAVNALNVFPVPDGDTGTNMSLTMRATAGAVANSGDRHVGRIAAEMAHGALMGARGNSGVILSQIVRGFAKAVEGMAILDGPGLAIALEGATRTAYQGVGKPVEGTILTVCRKASEAARGRANSGGNLDDVLYAATIAAREAVADTPNQLAVLKDAGVVDAGGQGLFLLMEGALRTLRGAELPEGLMLPVAAASAASGDEQTYGYCTEFLVSGRKLDADLMRDELGQLGDSLLVVGDDRLVRVHVHTFDPGKAIAVGTRAGILRQVKVDNMQLQHEDWREKHVEVAPLTDGVSLVAVASGDGFAKLFKSLGVKEIVAGGQTMNPSAEDLLYAVDQTRTRDVLLLPNNSNIVLTAKQAAGMSSRNVGVVPTTSLPEGIAAALAVQMDADIEKNVAEMTKAAGGVETGEVTTAVRDATFDGFKIAEGQSIGLHNGRVVSVGDSLDEAFWGLLGKMSPESAEILSIYYGSDCSAGEAEELAERIRERFSGAEVEVVDGGQPFYRYILSRE